MKKIILFSVLAALFTLVFSNDALAQSRKKKKKKGTKTDQYFDESGSIKHKLWYGSSVPVGFSGANNFSYFQIGLTPMVGYKITDNISVGPRFSLIYNRYKGFAVPVEEFDGEYFAVGPPEETVTKYRPFDFGAGAFARAKVFNSFFAHLEYETLTTTTPFIASGGGNDFFLNRSTVNEEIVAVKERQNNGFIGVGYNSSNGFLGYEILGLYNVLQPDDSFASPFSIRFGFTYNF